MTDRATFAYLCDVFVVKDAQQQGLAKAMTRAMERHQASVYTTPTKDEHPSGA